MTGCKERIRLLPKTAEESPTRTPGAHAVVTHTPLPIKANVSLADGCASIQDRSFGVVSVRPVPVRAGWRKRSHFSAVLQNYNSSCVRNSNVLTISRPKVLQTTDFDDFWSTSVPFEAVCAPHSLLCILSS